MRSLFTGDSLVGTCLGDSLLASCPRGDLTGDWVVFPGNLLLKTGMNYTYYPSFINTLQRQTQTFFKPYLNAQADMVFRQNRPTRRGHE